MPAGYLTCVTRTGETYPAAAVSLCLRGREKTSLLSSFACGAGRRPCCVLVPLRRDVFPLSSSTVTLQWCMVYQKKLCLCVCVCVCVCVCECVPVGVR